MKKIQLLALFLFLSLLTYSQNQVVGFFASWLSDDAIYELQYDKLTAIDYAFAQPTTSGGISFSQGNQLQLLVTEAHKYGVHVHISFGGANQGSSGWSGAVSSNSNRQNFANNVANFVVQYDLHGVNLDWEFPAGSQAINFADMAAKVRVAIKAKEAQLGHGVELTCAVSPVVWNNDGINSAFLAEMDYIYVMAFDGDNCAYCGGTNHSSMGLAENAYLHWTTSAGIPGANKSGKNAPSSKVILALPFYANSRQEYKNFSASDPSGYFNDEDGYFGGQYYNSKPVIEQKIDLMWSKGSAGVFIWEISQDRTDEYSLLGAIHTKMGNGGGVTCFNPDLGTDQELCQTSSITLSGVVNDNAVSYSWYKDNQVINGQSSSTLSVIQGGTYKVIVTKTGCTDRESEVEVISSLVTADDQTTCNETSVTLSINETPTGTVGWYESQNALTPLATGSNYLTPTLSNSVTYYVGIGSVGSNMCSGVDDWNSGITYTRSNAQEVIQVVYNDVLYEMPANVWWSSNQAPDNNPSIWTQVESCGGAQCIRTAVDVTVDNCVVCPNPDLGSDDTLCETTSLELNSGVNDSEVTFIWRYEGLTIGGQNGTNITITEPGIYQVTTSKQGCNTESAYISIESQLVSADAKQVCSGGSVTLQANQVPASGDVLWFSSANATEPLGSGVSFETPSLQQNTTYYVTAGQAEISGGEICQNVPVWDANTAYQRATLEVDIFVQLNGNKFKLSDGTYWTQANNPEVYTNVWTLLEACSSGGGDLIAECLRKPVDVTVSVCTATEKPIIESVGLYPNPAYGTVNLKGTDANSDVAIYSAVGTLALEAIGNTLDISDLDNGIYLVQMQVHGEKVVKRLIVED